MLDARNVYRKVTRKIYDFSPEQLANLTSIIWLYRSEEDRFLGLVESYLQATIDNAEKSMEPTESFMGALDHLLGKLNHVEEETRQALEIFKTDIKAFESTIAEKAKYWSGAKRDHAGLLKSAKQVEPLSETSRELIKQIDQLYKFIEKHVKASKERGLNKPLKELDELRKEAVQQLKKIRYIFKQAHWLQERFPKAQLRDVEGLVKLVDKKEIKEHDWSLTPGRYVGVAPEVEDEGFDFEETMRDIHIELKGLNEEAAMLAAQIQKNFEELGI